MARSGLIFDKASYHERRYNRQRKFAYEYLGNKCAICGSKKGLTITSKADRTYGRRHIIWGSNMETLKKQLDEAHLLCGKHYGEKISRAKGGFRHGTYYSVGRIKCRCDICEAQRKKWLAERRAKTAEQRRRVLSGRTERAFNPTA